MTASKGAPLADKPRGVEPNRVTLQEFRRRRMKLMDVMESGAIALIPGAKVRYRSRDTEYRVRQDSDFYYLTGFEEPEAELVLAPGRAHGEVVMFCSERDERSEQYTGERLGPERASQVLGLDDAFPIGDVEDILPGMLEGREQICMTLGEYPDFDRRLLEWVAGIRAREAGGAVPPGEFLALKHLLHEQRLYKSAAEVRLMSRAAEITTRAHERAMRACRPQMTETQLEGELIYEFMQGGARTPAYSCIVGGGANACVMHYVKNDAVLRDGDLVLIDAGCEYQHYACDVTRTFPVNGRFSPRQRDLYEVVLNAQRAGIDAAQPGADFNAPHDAATRVMAEGLVELGILDDDVDAVMRSESYRRFTVHKCSHWLGIDVHDVGDYRIDGTWRMLEAGMVITVEPGIYIPDSELMDDVPKRWRGMGIRIEDDVLIEKAGNRVLTEAAAKDPDEIEALMGR